MGLLDHPSESSWGYQVSSFFAPNSRMGSPDDLKYLIDYLHQNNIAVVMDFIPFHFCRDDYALNQFDGTDLFQPSKSALLLSLRAKFFHWGTKFFDYRKKAVRNFLLSSAVYWVKEMHIDALRVDAVHPILLSENLSYARRFLKNFNAVLHESFPGIQIIAEDYSGREETTQPIYKDGLGFDMKWNIAWMKNSLDYFTVHPMERRGSYQRIIKALESDAIHRMVMAISHDEVKKDHQPLLEMTPGLSQEEKLSNLRSFLAFMYTVPGKKLLFMGCDTGSEEIWETVIGTERGIDDVERTESKKKIQKMMYDLNHLYKEQRAFFEKDDNGRDLTWIEKNDPNRQVVAYRRTSTDGRQSFACVHNFTESQVQEFVIPFPDTDQELSLSEVFNSESSAYNGSGQTNSEIEIVRDDEGAPYAYKIFVPPLSTLIIQETS